MSIKEIIEKLKTEDRPVISVLAKGSQSKLIAVGLGKNVQLKEHKAPGPTIMVILMGQVEYKTSKYSKTLSVTDEFQIPMEEVHAVAGIEDSVFLLSVNM